MALTRREAKEKIIKEIEKEFLKKKDEYVLFRTINASFLNFKEKNPHLDFSYHHFYQFIIDNEIKMNKKQAPVSKRMSADKNKQTFGTLSNSKLKQLQKIQNRELVEKVETVNTENESEKPKEFEVQIYDPKDVIIDENSFIPLTTNKKIDEIISDEIGVMPGTTTVVVGSPGTGKTTLSLSILNDIQKAHPDSECMSLTSEMKKIDIDAEINKKPWMRNIKQVILSQHEKTDYLLVLQKVILHGYDFLVIDSFQNLTERLRTFSNMTGAEASNLLMELFEKANEGNTFTGKKTAIFLIQQVTKSGEFAGKNSLKHDTTAMLELVYNKDTNERYCFYSKNRRCGANQFKELFYYMNPETKEIEFDSERFDGDRIQETAIEREKDILKENKKFFNEQILTKGEETLFSILDKKPLGESEVSSNELTSEEYIETQKENEEVHNQKYDEIVEEMLDNQMLLTDSLTLENDDEDVLMDIEDFLEENFED